MTIPTGFPVLDSLRDTLAQNPPFCSGVVELTDEAFELYYGRENARFVDFSKSSENIQPVEDLARACEPAKFGIGHETVLDETYRKAGKMDAKNFVPRLDLESAGILDAVQNGLFPWEYGKTFRAELYKLNVYEKEAFFKAHQDTPRGQDMFGSLVVVYPVPHEGGALVLRHQGQEWTLESEEMLWECTHHLAYMAFFSDVEHEVLPVTSGYRVTLTYNLYHCRMYRSALLDAVTVESTQPPHSDALVLKRALAALLDDSHFLPEGGQLGFGLRHGYPFPDLWELGDPDPLDCVQLWLKGSDFALSQACTLLELRLERRLLYSSNRYTILLDHMVDLEDIEDEWEVDVLLRKHDGILVKDRVFQNGASALAYRYHDTYYQHYPTIEVHWVTDWTKSEGVRSQHVTYGNEASLGQVYAQVCLLVEIGPAGNRKIAPRGGEEIEEAAAEESNPDDEEDQRSGDEGEQRSGDEGGTQREEY